MRPVAPTLREPNGASTEAWVLVGLLSAVHAFAFLDRMLMALVAPLIKTALSLDDFQTGLLLSAFFVLSYAVSTFVLRAVSDRVNRVRLVVASIVLSSLATLGCGIAESFAGLALARMGLGLAQSILSPAAMSLIAQVLPPSMLGRGTSLYTSGATLGRSLALLLGGAALAGLQVLVLRWHGSLPAWRLVFVLFAVPNLLLALALVRVPEPARPGIASSASPSAHDLKTWVMAHRTFVLTHTLTTGAAVLVIQTVTAWTTTLLTRRFGVPLPTAGSTFGLIVLVAAPLGHWLGGAVLDALDRWIGLRAPGTIMAAALLVATPLAALLGLSASYAIALAGLTALTLVMGVASPAGLAAIGRATPEDLRGRATALFLFCVTSIGFGLGPPTLGLLTDRVFGAARLGEALVLVVVVAAVVGVSSAAVQWHRSVRLPFRRDLQRLSS